MLRTAVLAALVEQPAHGYDLTNRLNRRMGPVAQVDARRVYEILLQLEQDGLATSVEEEADSAPNRRRRVFSATELARRTYDSWLTERQQLPEVRADVHALIAFSTPDQAPRLLAMLREYEIDCLQMQERAIGPNLEGGSWRSRMILGARAAVCEQLRAELRWIATARSEIEEYLAEAEGRPQSHSQSQPQAPPQSPPHPQPDPQSPPRPQPQAQSDPRPQPQSQSHPQAPPHRESRSSSSR